VTSDVSNTVMGKSQIKSRSQTSKSRQ